MIQLEFNFFDDEAPEFEAATEHARSQNIRFGVIAQMIADRNQPVYTIARKIGSEMAATIKGMTTRVGPFQRRVPQVHFNNRMKALRALQRTLVESAVLSKQDVLNLEGPKFKFVLGTMIRLFDQALLDAGMEDFLARNVMLQFGHLLSANDGNIRTELNHMETASMRFPAHEESLLA